MVAPKGIRRHRVAAQVAGCLALVALACGCGSSHASETELTQWLQTNGGLRHETAACVSNRTIGSLPSEVSDKLLEDGFGEVPGIYRERFAEIYIGCTGATVPEGSPG